LLRNLTAWPCIYYAELANIFGVQSNYYNLVVKKMLKRFLAQHPTFGTKNKPRTLSYQQQSPYYWWWAYLRRNAEYLECCESGGKGKFSNLYKDFGDVREDDFKKWWNEGGRGGFLFGENKVALRLVELEDKSQWDDSWTKDDVLIVAVPLTSSKRYAQSRFASLLKARHTAKRGRTKKVLESSSSLYPLERNYTIENLQKTLQVYDLYIANKVKKPKVPMWKLGEQIRLVPSAMTTDSMSVNERQVFRNVMGASVKRYITNAEKMIANAALGKFPKT